VQGDEIPGIMTSDSGLREDTHPMGGIPLKEITGVVQFVMTNQVLKKGVAALSVHDMNQH
jgi:hypothetical protein